MTLRRRDLIIAAVFLITIAVAAATFIHVTRANQPTLEGEWISNPRMWSGHSWGNLTVRFDNGYFYATSDAIHQYVGETFWPWCFCVEQTEVDGNRLFTIEGEYFVNNVSEQLLLSCFKGCSSKVYDMSLERDQLRLIGLGGVFLIRP
jgi:hypothetical protein